MMAPNEKELLQAIHDIDIKNEKRFTRLETKIDDSINGRFKEHDRRISNLESNQNKIAWAIILAVVSAVMAFVLK